MNLSEHEMLRVEDWLQAETKKSESTTAPSQVVIFPTVAAWHEYLMTHPSAPRLHYCRYGCGGVGFFRKDVPVGHPHFGKAFPCACLAERAAQADQDQIEQYRESLSPIEQTFSLSNWIGGQQPALTIAKRAVAQGWGMFLFWGRVGRAKSGLLAGIVNDCLDRKMPSVYKVATQMLDELRAGYETESFEQQMESLRGVKVLALDEMWRFKQTQWAEEKIFQLLDYRYRFYDRLLTVVATNAEPQREDALWSRFTDARRGAMCEVTGVDVRPLA